MSSAELHVVTWVVMDVGGYQISGLSRDTFHFYMIMFMTLQEILHNGERQDERGTGRAPQEEDTNP